MIPFVKRHEDQVMTCLMILPIALLIAGLLGTVIVVIKRNTVTPDRLPGRREFAAHIVRHIP